MSLRTVLLVIGCLLLALSVLELIDGKSGSLPLAVVGAGMVLVTLFERVGYKPTEHGQPGLNWQPTEERFVDPVTGEKVTVFVRQGTGERRYVRSGKATRTAD